MKKSERTALLDTVAIMALGICAVLAVCLSIDWLRLYLFPIVVCICAIGAFGFLFLGIYEWRLKVNSK